MNVDDWKATASAAAGRVTKFLTTLEIRQDTKASVWVGVVLGAVVVALLVLFPGKPIDYTLSDGSEVPSELQISQQGAPAEETGTVAEGEGADGSGPGAGAGDASTLRRRRRAPAADGDGDGEDAAGDTADPAKGGEGGEERKDGGGREQTFDPDRDIDEDAIARRVTSGKAARLLGLNEEQVRGAIRDAKAELRGETAARRNGGYSRNRSRNGGGSGHRTSLSFYVDLVVYCTLFGALFYFVNRDYNGSVTKLLVAMFPREMAALGIGGGRVPPGIPPPRPPPAIPQA